MELERTFIYLELKQNVPSLLPFIQFYDTKALSRCLYIRRCFPLQRGRWMSRPPGCFWQRWRQWHRRHRRHQAKLGDTQASGRKRLLLLCLRDHFVCLILVHFRYTVPYWWVLYGFVAWQVWIWWVADTKGCKIAVLMGAAPKHHLPQALFNTCSTLVGMSVCLTINYGPSKACLIVLMLTRNWGNFGVHTLAGCTHNITGMAITCHLLAEAKADACRST